MPNYVYKCLECGHKMGQHRSIAERDNCPLCSQCCCSTKKIITPISFSFNEGERGESSKPDSYWNNAESEKQKRQAKEQKKVMEQSFYNDPKCPDKYKDMTFSKKEK